MQREEINQYAAAYDAALTNPKAPAGTRILNPSDSVSRRIFEMLPENKFKNFPHGIQRTSARRNIAETKSRPDEREMHVEKKILVDSLPSRQ